MRSSITSYSTILAFLLVALARPAAAAPPPGYYDSVDVTAAPALRATLHNVIDDHTRFPYSGGGVAGRKRTDRRRIASAWWHTWHTRATSHGPNGKTQVCGTFKFVDDNKMEWTIEEYAGLTKMLEMSGVSHRK